MDCFGRGVVCVKFSLETAPFADGIGPLCLLKWTALSTCLLSGVLISHQMRICMDCFSVYMVTQGCIICSWTSMFREEKMVPLLTTCSQKWLTYQLMSVRLHHRRRRRHSTSKCSLLSILAHKAKAIWDQGGVMAELTTHQTTSWNIKIPLKTSPMCSKLIFVEDQTTARFLYTSGLSTKSAGCYLNNINVVDIPPRKMLSLPCSIINDLGLKLSSI
jgi:hypothetical protein